MLNSIARVDVKVTDDYTWNSLNKCSMNAVGFFLCMQAEFFKF